MVGASSFKPGGRAGAVRAVARGQLSSWTEGRERSGETEAAWLWDSGARGTGSAAVMFGRRRGPRRAREHERHAGASPSPLRWCQQLRPRSCAERPRLPFLHSDWLRSQVPANASLGRAWPEALGLLGRRGAPGRSAGAGRGCGGARGRVVGGALGCWLRASARVSTPPRRLPGDRGRPPQGRAARQLRRTVHAGRSGRVRRGVGGL